MSFTVERALQQIQMEHPGEHLPMEKFLRVIHDEEYATHTIAARGYTGRQYRIFAFDCQGRDAEDLNSIFAED